MLKQSFLGSLIESKTIDILILGRDQSWYNSQWCAFWGLILNLK